MLGHENVCPQFALFFQVYVMHTLAASLSACIYQCLCGSHNYR
jgi:hypothetical protein